MTQAPAGWYTDPQTPTHQRYWDGQAWTTHVQAVGPHPPVVATAERRRLSGGAIVAIVIGAAIVVVLGISILAAIAIPVFLNQRERAADVDVESDLRTVANEILYYSVDYQALPDVTSDGTSYILSGPAVEFSRVPITEGVTLTQYVTETDDFCLAMSSQGGSAQVVHYRYSVGTVAEGSCG
ncbi:DUF2510 domain-containing protein [Demequina sp. NBRC 110053]|uniref:DUF2510 domain-containing protein n=1 Tax=Demequina sp. NBRC 110053 TaxID=1570342 RepID=UPI00135634E0|nr:DUF2510 domain-containing protein [Demequina sp. NBRC 110053]